MKTKLVAIKKSSKKAPENIIDNPVMRDIREVSKDIISLKFKKTDTLKSCMNKFFEVMKKHGIKEGTPSFNEDGKEVGRNVANFEWTMCKTLFMQRLDDFFTIEFLLGDSTPKELLK